MENCDFIIETKELGMILLVISNIIKIISESFIYLKIGNF